jgi:23S rRNA pseudouridine2604 synthase
MSQKHTYQGAEPVRINKWMAELGLASRREAEALIGEGRVLIDGAVVEEPGRKIAAGQTLELVASRGGARAHERFTAVLNKPVGFVSGQPEPGNIPAVRLLTRKALDGSAPLIPDERISLPPVGRLDKDSRGLLVLSNDGVLVKAVIGPQSEVDKEYLVTVQGRVDSDKLKLLRHGLSLDGKALRPAKVSFVRDGVLRFVLTEGRNRQIRRMCELVDLRVVDLFRIRIGPLQIGDLGEGRWRMLTPQERAGLIAASAPSADPA